MFADAIDCIAKDLDESLKRQLSLDEALVVVSNLFSSDGTLGEYNTNKLVLTLVRLEKDAVMQSANSVRQQSTPSALSYPPLHVNISLLISATFSEEKYPQALKLLNAVAVFFQSKPVLDFNNTPLLPKEIKKLTIEMEDVSLSEMSNLWGAIGAKHQPSLLYKIRTVVIQPDSLLSRTHLIDTPITEIRSDG